MISTAALLLLVTLGGADVRAATPTLAPAAGLNAATAGAPRIAAPPSFALRSDFLELDAVVHPRGERLAQQRRARGLGGEQGAAVNAQSTGSGAAQAGGGAAATTTSTSDAAASGSATTTATPSAEAAASTDASGAAAAPAEEEEPDIELLRHRERLTRIHRPLGIATWSSLLALNLLGTVLTINLPTAFGPGNCQPGPMTPAGTNPCFLGDFGSSVVPPLHTFFAISTVSLYAATGIFALAMPDPERASTGNDGRAVRLRIHKVMAWIHLVGMILQPILGVIAANPGVVGVQFMAGSTFARDFQAGMRTVHTFVGWTTFAALTAAWILEF